MSTDLFSSGRGPGLIGSGLALIVLLGFGLLFFFAFDERFQGGENIGKTIRDEAYSIERLHKNIAATEKRLAAMEALKEVDLRTIEAEAAAKSSAERLNETKGQVAAAKQELASTHDKFAAYKQSYRESERASAKGETYPELRTLSGKVYTNVNVRDVDAIRMQIRHDGGIAGIQLEELPLDLQDRFQVDTEEKMMLIAAEKERAETVNMKADITDLSIQIARYDKAIRDTRLRITQSEATIAKGAQMRNDLVKTRGNLQTELAVSRTGVSKAPQIEPKLESIRARIAEIDTQLPKLRADIRTGEQEARKLELKMRELRQEVDRRRDALTPEAPDAGTP